MVVGRFVKRERMWLAMTLLAVQATAGAGEFSSEARGSLVAERDDNPLLTSADHAASSLARASAALDMKYESETARMTLSPRLVSARYDDASELDYNAQYLDLNTSSQGQSFSPALQFSFANDTTLTSETAEAGIVQAIHKRRKWQANPSAVIELNEWVGLQLGLGFLDVDYQAGNAAGLYDYSQKSANLGLISELGQKDTLSLTLTGYTLRTPWVDQQTDYYSLNLAYDSELTEKSRFNASVGGYKIDFNLDKVSGANKTNDTGYTAQLSLAGQFEYASGNIVLARELNPGIRGNLTRQDKATLSLSRGLTESLGVNVNTGYVKVTELESRLKYQNRDYRNASLSLRWEATQQLSTSVTYMYRDYQARESLSDYDAASHIARLTIDYKSK